MEGVFGTFAGLLSGQSWQTAQVPDDTAAKTAGPKTPITRLTVATMDWLADEGYLQKDWQTRAHIYLDFSDGRFKLRTFQPQGFVWFGGRTKGEEDRITRNGSSRMMLSCPATPEVRVSRVTSLNLDGNDLHNDLFDAKHGIHGTTFPNLKILSVNHNKVDFPIIVMPKLRELYLNSNLLRDIPPLSGMPELEVLSLASNRIRYVSKMSFQGVGKSLQELDLSKNLIGSHNEEAETAVEPGHMYEAFTSLARKASHIMVVKFQDNPICVSFSEYQILLVRCLPSCEQIDDLNFEFNPALRQTLLDQSNELFGYELRDVEHNGNFKEVVDSYSQLVGPHGIFRKSGWDPNVERVFMDKLGIKVTSPDEAKQWLIRDCLKSMAGQPGTRAQLLAAKDVPEDLEEGEFGDESVGVAAAIQGKSVLHILTQELDEVLEEPSSVASCVNVVFETASRVSTEGDALFQGIRSTGQRKEIVVLFVQQVALVAERYQQSRFLLIRTLGRFCTITAHKMGGQCFAALYDLSQASPESMSSVVEVLREMIIPTLQELHIEDPRSPLVLSGLAQFDSPEVDALLGDGFHALCLLFKSTMHTSGTAMAASSTSRTEEADAAWTNVISLTRLLKCAVRNEAGAAILVDEEKEILDFLLQQVMTEYIFFKVDSYEFYTQWLDTLRHCYLKRTHECSDIFTGIRLTQRLCALVDAFFTKLKTKGSMVELGLAVCRKLGAVIQFIVDVLEHMQVDPTHAVLGKDVLDPKPGNLVELCCQVPKQEVQDPVVLCAVYSLFIFVLNDDRVRRANPQYVKDIVRELNLIDMESLYLLQYSDSMHEQCELHAQMSETMVSPPATRMHTPDVNGIMNPFAHQVILKSIRLMGLFSELISRTENETGEADWENALYKQISQVFNNLGRDKRLFKLLRIPNAMVKEGIMRCLGQMSPADLDEEEVLELLGLLNPNSVEQEELLLGVVLTDLQVLLQTDDDFRAKHGAVVLRKTWQILECNSARRTFGSKEEELQKRELSTKAVILLAAASESRVHILRRHLKSESVITNFEVVVKNEELHHSPEVDDVFVEMNWAGRQVMNLLRCLRGPHMLDPRKKQAFRIISRLADVLGGVPAKGGFSSLQERACNEANMWNDARLRNECNKMDGQTAADRVEQQRTFAFFEGVEQVLDFLESGHRNDNALSLPPRWKRSSQVLQKKIAALPKPTALTAAATAERMEEAPFYLVAEVKCSLCHNQGPGWENHGVICKRIRDGKFRGCGKGVCWECMDTQAHSKVGMVRISEDEVTSLQMEGWWLHENCMDEIDCRDFYGGVDEFQKAKDQAAEAAREAELRKNSASADLAHGLSLEARLSEVVQAGDELLTLLLDGEDSALQRSLETGQGPAGAPHESAHGHDMLDEVFMQASSTDCRRNEQWGMHTVKCFAFPSVPFSLETPVSHGQSNVQLPGLSYRVGPSYVLAAALRCAYALITLPAADYIKQKVILSLRSPPAVMRIITLIQRTNSLVECNLGAKFLALMVQVIRKSPSQSRVCDRGQLLSSYLVLHFARDCLLQLKPLMASAGSSYALTPLQLTLKKEATRALLHALETLSSLDVSSSSSALRTEVLLDRVMQPALVEAVFLAALYNVQADLGGQHGHHINEKFMQNILSRTEMKSLASEALAFFIWGCKRYRYEVFSLFDDYQVIGGARVVSSYYEDLLLRIDERAALGRLEEMLQKRYRDWDEHVLSIFVVELGEKQRGWSSNAPDQSRLLIITNKRLLLTQRRTHGILEQPCGRCMKESFCPVAPPVETEMHFQHITRIIPGPDPQLIILGMMHFDEQKEIEGETFYFLICQRTDVRQKLLETLRHLSGPKEDLRLTIHKEELISEAIERRMASPMLCCCYLRSGASDRAPLFAALTESELTIFEVDFSNWQVFHKSDTAFEDAHHRVGLVSQDHIPKDQTKGGVAADVKPVKNKQGRVLVDEDDIFYKSATFQGRGGSLSDKDGSPTGGIHKGYRTSWDDVEPQALLEVGPNREKARMRNEDTIRDLVMPPQGGTSRFACLGGRDKGAANGGTKAATEVAGGDEGLIKRLAADRRRGLLTEVVKEQVSGLASVEFHGDDVGGPSIRLSFEGEGPSRSVNLPFTDDAMRENWRRGIALVLHLGNRGQQWQREWSYRGA